MLEVKTLILHIGSWKTGTTAVQSFLARNETRLTTEGILYPRATRANGTGVDTAHHRFSAMLDDADGRVTRDVVAVLDTLAQEMRMSTCDSMLLSSETFMGMHRPETMSRYISADRVIVVVNLRHQPELVNAMYYTEVCYHKVIDQPMAYWAGFDRRKLNYLAVLDRWAKVWPGAEMRVGLFDQGTLARSFPVKHFLGQVGLDWELADSENIVEHPTQPAQATMVLRQLAESGYSDEEFFEIFSLFRRHPEFFSPIRTCFAPHVMQRIESEYADQNREMIEKYVADASPGFTPLDLPDSKAWSDALIPTEQIFPALVRAIAREAAAQLG